jgi:hypothetical protein
MSYFLFIITVVPRHGHSGLFKEERPERTKVGQAF